MSAALFESGAPNPTAEDPGRCRLTWTRRRTVGLLAVTGLLSAAALLVALTDMRPGYDAYGWLVWGRQALHWNLDTNGAPSWKPLPFLFTFPFALAGGGQLWLWMITAVAAAFAAPVFAARIAYRLVAQATDRRYASVVAAAFAAVAVLGLNDYSHQVLIANSDPMDVALCLAAIDAHLLGRRRLAFVALLFLGLGRPETWLVMTLYAVWLWRAEPSGRVVKVLGLVVVVAAWFVLPAITAKNPFVAGNLALGTHHVIHGNRVIGTVRLFLELYPLPLQLAVLGTLVFAAMRRERILLGLAATALLWIAIETGFVLRGWPGEIRYLMEPAAVTAVIAAVGVGRLVAAPAGLPRILRTAGVALAVALCVAQVPTADHRVSAARHWIAVAGQKAIQTAGLADAVVDVGGPTRIGICGQPTTLVGLQSELAYALDLNVGYVGHKPGKAIRQDHPIVLLKPHDGHWLVRSFNPVPSLRAACHGLWSPAPAPRSPA